MMYVYNFAGTDENNLVELGTCSAKLMSNMQGIFIGLYAASGNDVLHTAADFDWFLYQSIGV